MPMMSSSSDHPRACSHDQACRPDVCKICRMRHSTSRLANRTGAGVIFGATGGVMEAALRTAVEWLTGETLSGDALNFTDVRGTEGIKEASYKVGDLEVKVAVASGLKNARTALRRHPCGQSGLSFC